jgi:hypothetical protein
MARNRISADSFYDQNVVVAADTVANCMMDDVLAHPGQERGIHGTAAAGAGKSTLVSQGVGRARESGLRVAVAAPTNEQAFGLVRTIAKLYSGQGPGRTVTFVPAQDVALPASVTALPGVQEMSARDAAREKLIVGTVSKLGDAFARGDLPRFDLLFMDESYQADADKYFAVAGLAPVHLLVGDGGQISPFSTLDDPAHWRGLPEDPLQTAVGVLRRNHPSTPVYHLPITRRLDGRAVRLARWFYPNFAFAPAVLPDVRELRFGTFSAANGRRRSLDRVLDGAARDGWAHAELPQAAVLPADQETVNLLADLVQRLFDRGPHVRCERQPGRAPLKPRQVAVGVSHNDQKDFLRVALGNRGLGEVVVETANKLQGLEFEVVFVWHPLAGLLEPDGFHLDPGRLCVLLNRHRQACIVIGRTGDRDLLEHQIPPPTPAYLGWDPDPVLDGWEVHRAVFETLEPMHTAV